MPLVKAFTGDYVADTTPGILDISFTARDEVDVAVEDSLAGCATGIHANVEGDYHRVTARDVRLHVPEQRITCEQLLPCESKVVLYMTPRDDQGVQVRYWEPVPDRKGQLVLRDHSLWWQATE